MVLRNTIVTLIRSYCTLGVFKNCPCGKVKGKHCPGRILLVRKQRILVRKEILIVCVHTGTVLTHPVTICFLTSTKALRLSLLESSFLEKRKDLSDLNKEPLVLLVPSFRKHKFHSRVGVIY